MTVEIAGADSPTATLPARNLLAAMKHGAAGRCPSCGVGRLFPSYLKVADACPSCGQELHHHRADDAPPYFTMLILGHVLVGGALTVEQAFQPSLAVHAVLWLPLTVILSLLLLPPIKGALIGLQWANRMHGFGTGPDPAAPDEIPAPSR